MRPEARKRFAGRATKSACADRRSSSVEGNFLAKPLIKARALKPGDKIGVVAPASSFNREAFLAGCGRLRQMGYEPVYSENIFERDLYFAGGATRRLQELERLLVRDDVTALFGVRGGYGSNYLLPDLKFELFAANPKILLGCSYMTSLLT